MNATLLVPAVPSDLLGLARMGDEKLGAPTDALLFRDGRRWHFDDAGHLVAQVEPPLTVVYRRDDAHRILRIEGWYGKQLRADIRLAYDGSGRLVSAHGSNGVTVNYGYDDAGAAEATITLPGGGQYVLNRSADGTQETWRGPEGGIYHAEHDAIGRLITLRQDDRQILRQQWHRGGQLALAAYETVALHPEYREDGVPTGVLVTPPEEGPQCKRWLHITYDPQGNVANITDYSGADIKIVYDKAGEPATLMSPRGSVEVKRNDRGRLETVRTSWGYRQENSYNRQDGELRKIQIIQGHDTAAIDFQHGKPEKVRQFDGSELQVSYHDQENSQGLVKEVRTPNGLVLSYEYDSAHRLAAVSYGTAYSLKFTYDVKGRIIALTHDPVR